MTDLEQELSNAFKRLTNEQNKRFQELEQSLSDSQQVVEHLQQQVINLSALLETLTKRLS